MKKTILLFFAVCSGLAAAEKEISFKVHYDYSSERIIPFTNRKVISRFFIENVGPEPVTLEYVWLSIKYVMNPRFVGPTGAVAPSYKRRHEDVWGYKIRAPLAPGEKAEFTLTGETMNSPRFFPLASVYLIDIEEVKHCFGRGPGDLYRKEDYYMKPVDDLPSYGLEKLLWP